VHIKKPEVLQGKKKVSAGGANKKKNEKRKKEMGTRLKKKLGGKREAGKFGEQ